jgi:hypothetical protein
MRVHLARIGWTFFLAFFWGCGFYESDGLNTLNPELFSAKGTIRFIPLEGGFYGIVADSGEKYNPINLPEEFRRDKLRVWFLAKYRKDLVSVRMWGQIIELVEIRKIGSE